MSGIHWSNNGTYHPRNNCCSTLVALKRQQSGSLNPPFGDNPGLERIGQTINTEVAEPPIWDTISAKFSEAPWLAIPVEEDPGIFPAENRLLHRRRFMLGLALSVRADILPPSWAIKTGQKHAGIILVKLIGSDRCLSLKMPRPPLHREEKRLIVQLVLIAGLIPWRKPIHSTG